MAWNDPAPAAPEVGPAPFPDDFPAEVAIEGLESGEEEVEQVFLRPILMVLPPPPPPPFFK